ncbi:lysostaphin resistance A-like protein [Chloroflexota bacterium]
MDIRISALLPNRGKCTTRSYIPILCLIAIVSAEWLVADIDAVLGGILHVAILFFLISAASFSARRPDQRLYLSLSLVPIIRIASLSAPLTYFQDMYWHVIISVPIFTAAFLVTRVLNLSPADIGLGIRGASSGLLIQILVALSGIGLGVVEYIILEPEPLISALSLDRILIPALILIVSTGFMEEIVFRGIIQRSSLEVFGNWGIVFCAAMFAALYISYLSWVQLGFVFLNGLFFGWITKKTGSILGVCVAHGLINVCLYLILPFSSIDFGLLN